MEQVPTPYLCLDSKIMRENVRRLAAYAQTHRIGIRPHAKTHKSRFVAGLQLESGAIGMTVAKVGEAEVFAETTDDLLLAYPAVDRERCTRLAKLAQGKTIRVAIDSSLAADSLADAALRAGSRLGILVDVDVGLHRTGVQSAQAALELAQHVEGLKSLRLDGIMLYPGQVWSAGDKQPPELEKISAYLSVIIELWKRSGLHAGIVSGGSTPTAYRSHLIPEVTEIRPGTYVFNDMNTVRGGFCELADCAARIVCTVVSNAVPGQVVIDAGSKTLTSDRCVPALESGYGYVAEFPEARIVKLSEEHGQVDVSACARAPTLGQQVSVIPNHICPCVNLQDTLWLRNEQGSLEPLKVDARGKLS